MGNCRYSTQKREKPIMSIAWHEDKTDKSDYQEHMLRISRPLNSVSRFIRYEPKERLTVAIEERMEEK